MIITGIDHYTIKAPAEIIEACVSFYSSLLNLRLGFRPPLKAPGFWLYAGDRDFLHLVVDDTQETSVPSCLDHIAFTAVNLPVTIKRLEDLSIEYTTNHLAELDRFQVFIKDPAGLAIELNFSCEKL